MAKIKKKDFINWLLNETTENTRFWTGGSPIDKYANAVGIGIYRRKPWMDKIDTKFWTLAQTFIERSSARRYSDATRVKRHYVLKAVGLGHIS